MEEKEPINKPRANFCASSANCIANSLVGDKISANGVEGMMLTPVRFFSSAMHLIIGKRKLAVFPLPVGA